MYFMPPSVITDAEIEHAVAVAREGIDRATRA
jgi:adenosylmethionine-8-amino-7-oxononanoate aminotransferase